MQWRDRKLEDFKPVELDPDVKADDSDFSQYLKILQRFNLIQQKNLQRIEDLKNETVVNLEKSSELTNAFIQERTQLKNEINLFEKVLIDIFDLFDNMNSVTKQSGNQTLLDFVKPVNKVVEDIMNKVGWTFIPTEGNIADPNLHFVIQTHPYTVASDKDLIIGVVRPGYRCGERVVRKAEVAIYQ